MKYPITPEYIQKQPKELQRLYLALEEYILKDIAQRFIDADGAQQTAIDKIRMLQRRGYSLKDIEDYIKQFTGMTDKEFDKVMQDAVDRNQRYFDYVISKADIVADTFDSAAMKAEIDAITRQTKGELTNITRSLGFSLRVNGQTIFMPLASAYQRVLDDASIKVLSGGESYGSAIQSAINELTESGIRAVTYERIDASGKYRVRADHVDVAVRRAVFTGITQISGKYSDALMEQTDTPYVEITAHRGARDVKRAGIPWASHKDWQGKVYSKRAGDKYPSVYAVCGLGQVDGLEGANCRHLHYPWFEGISERTYTDEDLKNIDPPPFKYQGREYNAYEATQKMRQIERTIRKVKRQRDGYDKGTDEYKALNARVRRLFADYTEFSKLSGNPKQVGRTYT